MQNSAQDVFGKLVVGQPDLGGFAHLSVHILVVLWEFDYFALEEHDVDLDQGSALLAALGSSVELAGFGGLSLLPVYI